MQLRSARIENFKGIRSLELDLRSPWSSTGLQDQLVLVGDNGTGKTTALQAIALTLSLATRKVRDISDFAARWNGFLPDRLRSLGAPEVTLEVQFDDDEIAAVHEAYALWRGQSARPGSGLQAPGTAAVVTLRAGDAGLEATGGDPGLYQFRGRFYVKSVLKTRPDARGLFRRIGDIFWFDQHRGLGNIPITDAAPERETWSSGVGQLRESLLRWWGYHTRPDRQPERDWVANLARSLNAVFPDTRLSGPLPRGDLSDVMYFMLERNGIPFEISEMSSGEQTVLALMHPFAFQDIHRSVVLIDEVELHLHPSGQQLLVGALPNLGDRNQFLLTTHAGGLVSGWTEDQVRRLPGGAPCL